MLPLSPTNRRPGRPTLTSLVSDAGKSLGVAVNGDFHSARNGMLKRLQSDRHPQFLQSLPSLGSAVPSPKTGAFIVSCLLWYLSSALSSNTSKALLSSPKHILPKPPPPFPFPVTLTLAQFFFVHIFSSAISSPNAMRWVPGVRRPITRIVKQPGWDRILDMAKLSFFNVLGHALSSVALSRVPVSTVHTIKALTPLFTVLSFRFLFDVTYSTLTYVALFPLTLGVMMACTSLSFSANDIVGLLTALGSTLVFVAQSIYSKKLIGRGSEGKRGAKVGHGDAHGHGPDGKLDKINILYYSSACSVVIMLPMALYYDGTALLFGRSQNYATWGDTTPPTASALYVLYLLLSNGVVHFAQNLLAFSVLALVSPVTYSIASLFKRVFVICFAILWFGQSVSLFQWVGIVLTFVGLYLYNDSKASKSVAKGEEKMRRDERVQDMQLPTSNEEGLRDLRASAGNGDLVRNTRDSKHQSSQSSARPISITTTNLGGGGQQQRRYSPVQAFHNFSGAGMGAEGPHNRRFSVGPEAGIASAPANVVVYSNPTQEVKMGGGSTDPRASIPSPPPSRRSSTEEQPKMD